MYKIFNEIENDLEIGNDLFFRKNFSNKILEKIKNYNGCFRRKKHRLHHAIWVILDEWKKKACLNYSIGPV